MGIKSIVLTASLLLVSTASSAVTISANDWHLSTDGFGGLKQSWNSPDVFFAVTSIGNYNLNDTYEAVAGFHFATTAEYIALTDILNTGGTTATVYYNQGGWAGYTWEGRDRYAFLFSDSYTTGKMLHAGGHEVSGWLDGSYTNLNYVITNSTNEHWAGFVMVKDSVVPVPAAAWLFGSGLLGLIGVARRKARV